MRASLTVIILALALVTAASPALGLHEEDGCEPTESQPDLAIAGAGIFETSEGIPGVGGTGGVFVYHETNGLDGLQRDDPLATDETCGHPADGRLYAWAEGSLVTGSSEIGVEPFPGLAR